MLPNPLTPPLGEPIEYDDDHENEHTHMSTLSNPLLATPTSLPDPGMDMLDTAEEDRGEETQYAPEDEDMSDEEMPHSAASLLAQPHFDAFSNSNIESSDFDEMDVENMIDMFSSSESNSVPEVEDSFADQVITANADIMQTLPAALQDVTAQLQHLQNEVEPMHFFQANSTSPFSSTNTLTFHNHTFGEMAPEDLPAASDVMVESSALSDNIPPHGGIVHTVEVVMSSAPQSLHDEPLPAQENQFWGDADEDEVEERLNLSLGDFLDTWARSSLAAPADRRLPGPSLTEVHAQRYPPELPPVRRKDLRGDDCDIQRIDWNKLRLTRKNAMFRRRQTYRNYTNLRMPTNWHRHLQEMQLPDAQNHYRFRKMDFSHNIALSHFQLRNLVSCASRDHVFYASRFKVMHWNPLDGFQGSKRVAMSLKNPIAQSPHGVPNGIQISTLTVGHDILVAGGFGGEYALLNLKAPKDTKHTEGIVTNHENSITNHLQVYLSRTSQNPQVAIASNDHAVRLLEVATNRIVADHAYEHAINCTAISPDRRLRVMVGDTREVMICHADTGEVLQSLKGHEDYGFACDWADDGWTVATGNQDLQIKIWDARMWTNSSGESNPRATIAADQAGIRKLKFSPLGSGKRILVAAEPADIVHVIDAETFEGQQKLQFIGEIGGFDFSDGGRDLIVANCDSMRGGMMEFERCNLVGGSLYEHESKERSDKYASDPTGYDWCRKDEDLDSHRAGWGTVASRRGKTTLLGSQMGHF